MPAYIIFVRERIHDDAYVREYRDRAKKALTDSDAQVLVAYGRNELLKDQMRKV